MKRNFILQSAIAVTLGAAALGAQAGTFVSAPINFATQNFGPTSTAALGITPGTQTYTYNTTGGIVLNNGGVINMYFRLGNGALFTAVPVLADFSGSVVTGLLLTKSAVALSTDKKTVVLTLTNSTGANVVIGVGATLTWTPSAGNVNTVNTILNSVGGAVTLQGAASVLAANANTVLLPGAPTNADTGVDNSPSNVVNIALGATAITPSVCASSSTAAGCGFAAAETQKIDVTVTPSQTALTAGVNAGPGSTTKVNFGSFKFTDVAGVMNVNGTTPYTVATNLTAAGTGAVATGNFAGALAAGMVLTTDTACAAPLAAGSVGVISADKTTATWTGATTAATGVNTYVCMTIAGTPTTVPVTTPTLTTSTSPIAGTDAKVTGSGTLYALTLNGASVQVRNYIPACSGGGYSSFVRIVNGGNASAPVSVAVIDPTTGLTGASNVLATIAAGGATTFTATQVEVATGAITPCTSRPRLLVTSPTASLQVSSFFLQPDGNFNEVSGGQLSNPAPAVVPTGN